MTLLYFDTIVKAKGDTSDQWIMVIITPPPYSWLHNSLEPTDLLEIWHAWLRHPVLNVYYTVSTKKVTPCIHCDNSDKHCQILTEFRTNNAMSNCKQTTKFK